MSANATFIALMVKMPNPRGKGAISLLCNVTFVLQWVINHLRALLCCHSTLEANRSPMMCLSHGLSCS